MSTNSPAYLHNALLRPAVLHILRASGFHGCKPSVLDTLTDITARYMLLLANQTAFHACSNHNETSPTLTDVRMALADCALLVPSMTAAEEAWTEVLRRPLEEYPERNGLRRNEMLKREEEDTSDIREFINWIKGPQNREISRVAGLLGPAEDSATEVELGQIERDDFLMALKKKTSKTGEESRYQGTVLGIPPEVAPIKIEGGPAESIRGWNEQVRKRIAKLDVISYGKGGGVNGGLSSVQEDTSMNEG